MSDHRFPKQVRLLRAGEFERVFNVRNSASNAWIALYGATSELRHARLGLTVSRRVGSAVVRNRWKRLLREAFRTTQSELPPLDLVCVVRGQSPPTLGQMRESLLALSNRIQVKVEERANRREGSRP
jgi:ribonuclease P protein component